MPPVETLQSEETGRAQSQDGFVVGVDVGGTKVAAGLVDNNGEIRQHTKIPMSAKGKPAEGLGAVLSAVSAVLDNSDVKTAVSGIGICSPGPLDPKSGVIINPPNLPCWRNYPLAAEVSRIYRVPVKVDNDANAAAFGENWLGAARNVEDMAMLTLGTGVGGGIVLGRAIWHGMTGMAGEFGHITVEPEGVQCGCGNRGCLEQYASATAVVRMAREAIEQHIAPGLSHAASANPEFSAKAVYNLAIQGDDEAKKIFRRVGRALGIVIADLVNALNLPMYVVGGGVSSAWEAFSPAIFDELKKRSMVYAATAPPSVAGEEQGASAQVEPGGPTRTIVTRALLGSDAGLYGAARLPMIAAETVSDIHPAGATMRKII